MSNRDPGKPPKRRKDNDDATDPNRDYGRLPNTSQQDGSQPKADYANLPGGTGPDKNYANLPDGTGPTPQKPPRPYRDPATIPARPAEVPRPAADSIGPPPDPKDLDRLRRPRGQAPEESDYASFSPEVMKRRQDDGPPRRQGPGGGGTAST